MYTKKHQIYLIHNDHLGYFCLIKDMKVFIKFYV